MTSVAFKKDDEKSTIKFKDRGILKDKNMLFNEDEKRKIRANEEFLLGNSLYKKNDFAGAILKYKLSINYYPDIVHVYANLGNCLRENGEYEESVMVLQKSVFLNDKNPKNWYNLGVTYQTMGQYNNAIDAYDHATQLDDLLINAHYNKGMVHTNRRQW